MNVRQFNSWRGKWIAVALAVLVGLTACDDGNILPDPGVTAASLPGQAEVAVGATHDLLIAACQDHVSLLDLFMPVAATALFVGLGRLDALFYLPGAMVESVVPSCKAKSFSVQSATIDATAVFQLEPTANPAAFHAHAITEGPAVFSADLIIDGEVVRVSSTLRAWNIDRVEFAPVCDATGDATPSAVDWVPAGHAMTFSHRLYHGATELSGYGVSAVTDGLFPITEFGRSSATVRVDAPRGEHTLTSSHDPAYTRTLFVYDVSDFTGLSLEWMEMNEAAAIIGHPVYLEARTTLRDQTTPCVQGFARTVTIETPEVCGGDLDTFTLTKDQALVITPVAAGLCRVSIALEGSALSDFIEFQVHEGFMEVPLGESLNLAEVLIDLWVAGPEDLFIVGYDEENFSRLDGLILHRSGGQWQPSTRLLGSGTLRAVHGLAPDGPVWAVGNNGVAARFDGAAWTVIPTGVTETLHAVFVAAADDVWAVGDAGVVVHWDGAAWTAVPSGTSARLAAVWAPPEGGDPIVAGSGRTVLRMTTSGPQAVLPVDLDAPGFDSANDIDGVSVDDFWLSDNDSPLHHVAGSWTTPVEGLVDQYAVDVYALDADFTYFLVNRNGKALVLRQGTAGSAFIPVTDLSCCEDTFTAIGGAGDAIWVLYRRALHRYTHDPLAVFP